MFKERLKQLRIEKELNQPELAKQLNVAKQTVSNWENGNRTPDSEMLIIIADFFDCSVDYLLGRTEDRDTLIIKSKVDGHDIEMGIDRKDYPNGLTHEQVVEVFKELESVGFDVNKLIDKVKNNK
jgi:transcriptional regulator with XRE-family HTH domain